MTLAATFGSRPPIGGPSVRMTVSLRPVSETHIATARKNVELSNEKHHMRPYLAFGTPPRNTLRFFMQKDGCAIEVTVSPHQVHHV